MHIRILAAVPLVLAPYLACSTLEESAPPIDYVPGVKVWCNNKLPPDHNWWYEAEACPGEDCIEVEPYVPNAVSACANEASVHPDFDMVDDWCGGDTGGRGLRS